MKRHTIILALSVFAALGASVASAAGTSIRRAGQTVGSQTLHMPFIHTTHASNCSGQCALGIDAPPPDQLLVLVGFVFEPPDGIEHPISTIAIEPDPDDPTMGATPALRSAGTTSTDPPRPRCCTASG
jgi:hypothetical protein